MSGNSFGQIFKITTFGESHGKAIGVVVDGCPPKIPLEQNEIQKELDRRRPGQSKIVTKRTEEDKAVILSGVFAGKTLGTPIAILVYNKNAKATDYQYLKDKFRPSHADFTWQVKYGIRDWRGGGRASARETAARVAAGAIAKKVLAYFTKTQILAFVSQVHSIKLGLVQLDKLDRKQIEANIIRCPNPKIAQKMIQLVKQVKKEGDSVGGVITCIVKNTPIGLGEPVFDKLSADLAKACFSIPAVKGFEIGSGFASAKMKGSQHNDEFFIQNDKARTKTNFSGGTQGGISNGEDIIMRLAFKPPSTIQKPQKTVNNKGRSIIIKNIRGRHDPCVVPRAIPIVEAMVAITLTDHYLRQKASSPLPGVKELKSKASG